MVASSSEFCWTRAVHDKASRLEQRRHTTPHSIALQDSRWQFQASAHDVALGKQRLST